MPRTSHNISVSSRTLFTVTSCPEKISGLSIGFRNRFACMLPCVAAIGRVYVGHGTGFSFYPWDYRTHHGIHSRVSGMGATNTTGVILVRTYSHPTKRRSGPTESP